MNDNALERDPLSSCLTHRDIADALGVSIPTIKHYRNKFPEFIPTAIQGKPLRFAPAVIEVCRAIRECFGRGMSIPEIRDYLYNHFTPVVPAKAAAPAGPLAGGPGLDEFIKPLRDVAEQVKGLIEKQAEVAASLSKISAMLEDRGLEVGLGPDMLEALAARFEKTLAKPAKQKKIKVKNIYGDVQEYTLGLEPDYVPEPAAGHPGPAKPADVTAPPAAPVDSPAAEALVPPNSFINLPLVILSSQGEFLGAAGKAHGTFSVADFQALLKKSFAPPNHFEFSWARQHSDWVLKTSQNQPTGPRTYELHLEQTRTPKGNLVALVNDLYVDARQVPTVYLYTFIKQTTMLSQERQG